MAAPMIRSRLNGTRADGAGLPSMTAASASTLVARIPSVDDDMIPSTSVLHGSRPECRPAPIVPDGCR
jgi:hypothetical protein